VVGLVRRALGVARCQVTACPGVRGRTDITRFTPTPWRCGDDATAALKALIAGCNLDAQR
jgi:hypothetical protein